MVNKLVSKKVSRNLLSTYYHIISSIDGKYYRGTWGYTHCACPNPDMRIYFESWVLPQLRKTIQSLKIIDDTQLLIETVTINGLHTIESINPYKIRAGEF